MTVILYTPSTTRSLAYALLSLALVVAASLLGQLATYPAIPTWYAGLTKPFFTPPNAAFPIAWTILYLLMAYAFWRVLRLPAGTAGRKAAIAAYLVQLALNAGWSFAFFGARLPWLGMVVIVALLAAIVVCWRRFRALDRPAALCLVPYFLWVLYASALNFGIAVLN